jgi:hypothetical protein
MKYSVLLLLGALAFLVSCEKEEASSPIPIIKFDGFVNYVGTSGKDTAVDFIFTIKDGDGDIGFGDNEIDTSCGADNANLYLAYEVKDGSVFKKKKLWIQVTEVTPACDTLVYFDSVQVKFNQRMQYIEPPGNSKSIEATVTYRMDYNSALVLLDNIGRFEFYIRDRANNKSNVVLSNELILNK